MSEWIAVEDRSPEPYEYVLIWDGGNVYIASKNEFGEWSDTDFWAFDPSYWMPLPNPPEEKP